MCLPVAAAAAATTTASTAAATTAAATTAATAATTAASLSALEIASLGMTALSMGTGLYGSVQSAKAQEAQLNYQAGIDLQNAERANFLANDALERGELEAKQNLLKMQQFKGEQRSAFASTGVVVDEGSAFDTISDTDYIADIEAEIIRSNAEREAYGYKSQAGSFSASSGLNSMAAGNSSALYSGGSTILTGGSMLADKWNKYTTPTTK